MRRIASILVGLYLCGSVWAGVTITLTKVSDTKIVIGYNATTESQLVRAFALDIMVDDGNILDISDYAVGDDNYGYGIFPANFGRHITVLADGTVDNWDDPNYTPAAPPDTPGALGGLGTDGITIEMGSLYDTSFPGKTGVLCTITVSEGICKLCVNGNPIRGNIVMEDGSEVVPVEACIDYVCFDEFPNGPGYERQYADWVMYGKPMCWCGNTFPEWRYQCDCDCDGKDSGPPFRYRVYTGDLNCVVGQWKKKIGSPTLNPCADIDHRNSGPPFQYRVYTGDLNICIANWKKKDAQLPGNCPRPE
jgi:hypothetical protein